MLLYSLVVTIPGVKILSELTPKSTRQRGLFWLGLGLLIAAAVALRAALFNSFPLSPDEGIHLMWLRLLSAGYRPYSEVYITYPPFYPLAIEAVWNFWPTEAAQRWFSVVYTIFGVVGIALIARQFAGTVAGLATAVLALFSPPLVEPSRAVLGEFPSIAWSVWAVWAAWAYLEAESPRARRGWLILSGLCLSASLLTKLLSPFIVALIPLILVSRWLGEIGWPLSFGIRGRTNDEDNNDSTPSQPPPARGRSLDSLSPRERVGVRAFRPLLTDLIVWGVALIAPVLILLVVFDTSALVQQVVDQRLEARAAYTTDETFWPPRYERGLMFFEEDPALVILGLIGLGVAWAGRHKRAWLLTTWLGLALLMLAVHNPIRYKHFLILIPPLAILGGFLISRALFGLTAWLRQTPRTSSGLVYTLLGGLSFGGLAVWQVGTAMTVWQAKADVPQPPPDEVEALAFIDAVTGPDDCLITDDMQLVYWSGRMVPPELAEVSSNRLKSGALTLDELIAISDAYDCQLVAAVSNRIPKYLPDYMEWVKSKYLGRFHYGEDDLFFAKIDTDPTPTHPLWANFDQQLIFHGYSLPPTPLSPGERVPLTLVWQAQAAPPTDYAIFVQLRDVQNRTLVSADHQPYQGHLPTSTWPAGAVIQEMTWLDLPPDLPPDDYPLYVGLYDPATLERLPLLDDTSGENSLILGPLVVR